MKQIKKKCLEYLSNATLVNIVTISAGIIFILVSAFCEDPLYTVLISIGTSILATAIVTFLNSKYLIKQRKINEMVQTYGLDGIYKTRAEANVETNELLKNVKRLDVCAMGLKSFRESQGNLIEQKISEGLKMRILTIDPNSEVLSKIDINENNAIGSTKKSIEDLINWVNKIKEKSIFAGQVEIKTYNRYPYDFYFCIDGDVFTGPYHNKSSQQTITYKYLANTPGANIFTDNFDVQWENAQYVK